MDQAGILFDPQLLALELIGNRTLSSYNMQNVAILQYLVFLRIGSIEPGTRGGTRVQELAASIPSLADQSTRVGTPSPQSSESDIFAAGSRSMSRSESSRTTIVVDAAELRGRKELELRELR